MKILDQILKLLGLLATGDDGQKRRNLRLLLRKQRKFERILKRRGLTDEEKQLLKDVNYEIYKAIKAIND